MPIVPHNRTAIDSNAARGFDPENQALHRALIIKISSNNHHHPGGAKQSPRFAGESFMTAHAMATGSNKVMQTIAALEFKADAGENISKQLSRGNSCARC